MDSMSKKLLKELEEMQQQTGRMLRNMSISRMMMLESGIWQPPVDIYESEDEFYVYFDLAGVAGDSFSVIAGENQLRVYGQRQLPGRKTIACVHQLEIELGSFDRTLTLPAYVDVERVTSSYSNGILTVVLPKKQKKGKVHITIFTGDE